jgi:hypothetical protein
MSSKKLCATLMFLFPIVSYAQNDLQLITCDGIETHWNSMFGSSDTKEQTTKTYGIKNNKISMGADCPISSQTNIMCELNVGPGQIPGVLEIKLNVDLDRVSGRIVQTDRTETTSESEIRNEPKLAPFIGNNKTVVRVNTFVGYCKKAKPKF